MRESYEGSCHCGRVRFRVRADLASLLECNCSVCTKKGILHLIVPPEDFELVQGGDDLATYQFNTNTARHTFCRHCGMHPFYVPRSDPDKISVNARCLDGVDPAALRPASFFDGRNWEAAQEARRAAQRGEVMAPRPTSPVPSTNVIPAQRERATTWAALDPRFRGGDELMVRLDRIML